MMPDERQIEQLIRAAIERIVAEVQKPTVTNNASSNPNIAATKPISTEGNSNEFAIAHGVIGTRELQEIPPGTRRVAVRRGAVLTPAAKDWLRGKKIDVVWKTKEVKPASAISTTKQKRNNSVVIGEAAAKSDATAIAAMLTKKGYAVERLARSGLESVAGELAVSAARDGRRAVLLTDRPFAAVVAANRHGGTRAAWLRDRGDAQRAVREIDVNLAVIDPTGRSIYELTNILIPFLA